jgi:choline-sulfatase
MDWVPTQDEEGRFVRGGHARMYVPPLVGVRPWTKFLSYDEETHFRALEFIRERARDENEREPFFLVTSYHHPHDPFQVTQAMWDEYADVDLELPEVPDDVTYSAMDRWANEAHETDVVDLADPDSMRALRRAYAALVTYIDRKLGELLDTLEATGQAENTIVVFTSDHGDMLGERRMVQKRTFYEWSARIPLVVRVPGGAARTVADPVSLLDLAPTLLDLCDVDERLPMDGESFAPLLEGASGADRVVLSEYHVEKVRAPCFMARRGNHKLIYIHGHERQLFDLATDPHEWENLAGRADTAQVEEELLAEILQRFDPDAIAADGAASVTRRDLIRRANARNGTKWDYSPFFDAKEMYVR